MFSEELEWELRVMSIPKWVIQFLGCGGTEATMKGRAFTIDHHCCQQAPLLAAQSVMGLALLVPEAGHTLGAGQVLTGGMFYAGTLAVCASRPRATRKKICVSQLAGGNSRG